MCTKTFSAGLVVALVLMAMSGAAGAYNSGNILSNCGFEKGDLSEAANDAMGGMPWQTSANKNAIVATQTLAHGGKYSLEWKPIGWNVKGDGTPEDASTYIINNCAKYVSAGAKTINLSGYANTSALAPNFQLQVILANSTFKNVNLDARVSGGGAEWQQFKASLPLDSSDATMFIAFMVIGTKGVGAPGSAVYIDDLELSYAGPDAAGQQGSAPAPIPPAEPKAYDSGNVLTNGGFESGDTKEAANDALGNALPWLTSNTQNAIAATGTLVHAGKFSLEWKPIGWNVKDDKTLEDAGTYMLNNCSKYIAAGAREAHLSGFANTSLLASSFRLQVVLANGTFKNMNTDVSLAGGVADWQRIDVALPLEASDTGVIVAFSVWGTKGTGAPGSAVYLDNLELSYRGKEAAPQPAAQPGAAAAPAQPAAAALAATSRPFYMGFTPFAWDKDEEVANRSMKFVVTHGDIVAQHLEGGVPWTEALEDKPFNEAVQKDWQKRKEGTPKDVKVYLAVTPINGVRNGISLYRGEKDDMPLPDAFKNAKFSDEIVKKAYLNYCRRALEFFQPSFMAIGIEINEMRHTRPEQWPALVELYNYVRDELKKTHPDLPIFATITLHNLLNKDWPEIEKEREDIKAFLANNDIAGVSFYSFFKCLGPAEKPKESFDWIRQFVGNKPIAICETAYPAEPTKMSWVGNAIELPGSLEAQKSYYETLFDAAIRDNYLFVITFLYRDYDRLWDKIKGTAPDWQAGWKDCGLLNGDGEARPAWFLYEQYRALPYKR